MTGKEANHNPGLNPIEGHQFSLGIQIRPVDKFTGLSLGTEELVLMVELLLQDFVVGWT